MSENPKIPWGAGEWRQPRVRLIMQVMFTEFILFATLFFLVPIVFPDFDLPAPQALRQQTGFITLLNDPADGPYREGLRLWLGLSGAPASFFVNTKCGSNTTKLAETLQHETRPVTLTFDPRPGRGSSTLVPVYSVFAISIDRSPLITYAECKQAWMQENRFMIYPAVFFLTIIYWRLFRAIRSRA